MTITPRDEENLDLDAARAAAAAVGSGDELARMKRALLEVSIQRVRMRNEMFSEPMTGAEIDRLIADNPLP